MISVFCVSHVPALLTLPIAGYEGHNLLLIVFLVLVVQASDVLVLYIWGKLLGRHPIAPRLSPSKTIEGFAGGTSARRCWAWPCGGSPPSAAAGGADGAAVT